MEERTKIFLFHSVQPSRGEDKILLFYLAQPSRGEDKIFLFHSVYPSRGRENLPPFLWGLSNESRLARLSWRVPSFVVLPNLVLYINSGQYKLANLEHFTWWSSSSYTHFEAPFFAFILDNEPMKLFFTSFSPLLATNPLRGEGRRELGS